MKLSIHESGRKPDEILRRELERELAEMLSRLSPRIRSALVSVRDVNGPRGGVDQEIRVIVRLASGGKIVVRHRTDNVSLDLPATIRRVVHAVRNQVSRQRRVRRVGYRRQKDILAA